MTAKQERMKTLQGKVSATVKERIVLLTKERGISESELIREMADDLLNGSGNGSKQNNIDTNSLQPQINELQQQVNQLRISLSTVLELVLINLTDDSDAVRSLIKHLRSENMI